ncbi:2-hydroxyacid dehydrogenase [Zunongwangia endophytica]|uniref:2-hydroxyacid dehydrogenase n=1 Tax=Zunongwangia endophytica TaxID=1808945 RepID=A0ABV8H5R4_9FLAO|nr:2-hydroxyacid dehydrogenase [Zunongwangia endophytica]MDN3595930.1 2-hydroxyacid dehydrogenase [Zunongwangia endophytica]
MKLAFFSTKSYDKEFFDHYDQKEIQLKYFEVRLYKDTANLAKNYDGVCVFVHDDLDEETLEILAENDVKFVVLRCAGFNNVNLAAADKVGIKVYRVPAYSPEAVAEHAVALILTLNRKTHKAYNRIREGNFSLERLRGFNLHGKTVGVIGTGKIGSIFAKNMRGFGCKIIAYDKFENPEILENGGTYVSFEELMRQSDIISLHCPLNPETKHIINEESFQLMKDGMMLINTSRGPLINTLDTIEALKSGKLGYLGIDVYEQEEQLFFKDLSESIIKDDVISRLISFPNVLITAHQGFLTKEALQQIAEVTIQNISDFQEGRDTNNQLKV